MAQHSLATHNPGKRWPQRAVEGRVQLEDFLVCFAEHHGRTLTARARRHFGEIMDYMSEFFDERGVTAIAKRGGAGGVVSLSNLTSWLDAFEGELFDSLEGEREKLRVADGAIRALTRRLEAAFL